jgi:hypothetical protein
MILLQRALVRRRRSAGQLIQRSGDVDPEEPAGALLGEAGRVEHHVVPGAERAALFLPNDDFLRQKIICIRNAPPTAAA